MNGYISAFHYQSGLLHGIINNFIMCVNIDIISIRINARGEWNREGRQALHAAGDTFKSSFERFAGSVADALSLLSSEATLRVEETWRRQTPGF